VSYGDLIRDAFRITLRNRFLWVFGFFAGSAFFNFPSGGGNFDTDDFERSGTGTSALGAQFGPSVLDSVVLVVGIVVVVLLIVLLFIVMFIISQGALSESVAAIDRGEGRRFGSTFRTGLRNFWRVLGYYVLFFLIAVGLLVAIGVPTALVIGGTFVATQSTGARIIVAVLAGLVALALLILIFVPLHIISRYALREIVVRRMRVFGSVGSGYGVFRSNLGRSLLLWLIHIGLMIGIGIALLVAVLLVGLVLFIPTIALGLAEYTTAAWVAGVIAGLILLPLLLVASGAAGTFGHSYWTLAYLRLTTPTETAPTGTTPPPDSSPSLG
jgi:membrane-anchored glycerophosphoryl diester phosphodiesterase (GDPDase)